MMPPTVQEKLIWNMAQLSWYWSACAVVALGLISIGIVLYLRCFSNDVDKDAGARRAQAVLDTARARSGHGELGRGDLEALRRGLKS